MSEKTSSWKVSHRKGSKVEVLMYTVRFTSILRVICTHWVFKGLYTDTVWECIRHVFVGIPLYTLTILDMAFWSKIQHIGLGLCTQDAGNCWLGLGTWGSSTAWHLCLKQTAFLLVSFWLAVINLWMETPTQCRKSSKTRPWLVMTEATSCKGFSVIGANCFFLGQRQNDEIGCYVFVFDVCIWTCQIWEPKPTCELVGRWLPNSYLFHIYIRIYYIFWTIWTWLHFGVSSK